MVTLRKLILEEKKPQLAWWKIGVLTILLLSGAVASFAFGKKLPVEGKKEVGKVLGTQIDTNSIQNTISDASAPYVDQLQKASLSVLTTAQQNVVSIASQSAEQAKEYVIDSAIGKLVEQMKVLPQPAQDEIKKEICK